MLPVVHCGGVMVVEGRDGGLERASGQSVRQVNRNVRWQGH